MMMVMAFQPFENWSPEYRENKVPNNYIIREFKIYSEANRGLRGGGGQVVGHTGN